MSAAEPPRRVAPDDPTRRPDGTTAPDADAGDDTGGGGETLPATPAAPSAGAPPSTGGDFVLNPAAAAGGSAGFGTGGPGAGDGVRGVPVDEYVLSARLGGGAYGTVFRARNRRLERAVALKVFAPRAGGPGEIDPVLHEARAAARLEHPHAVRVFRIGTAPWTAALRAAVAAGRSDGGARLPPAGAGDAGFIACELVTGGTLARQFREYHAADISGTPPAWSTPHGAVRFLLPVADALAHAHARGVIHRDVKPANVLLRRDGSPAITDFGIARASRPLPGGGADASTMLATGSPEGSGTLSAEGRVLGTPAYMAPEQAKPWSAVGPQADVYSLAVVLWELLAGERMYRGEAADVLERIVSEPAPPLPAKVPKAVRRLVKGCLRKNPADRPADGFALAAAMRAALPAEKPLWTRRRVFAAGVGGATVLSAGAFAGWAAREREADPRLRPSASGWEPGPAPAGPAPAAGLRRVEVVTDPPGAAAWLCPLDGDGLPDPARRVDLPRRTPARIDVPPGAYLLTAEHVAARGPGGAEAPVWHEAVRWVPEVGRAPAPKFPAYGFTLGGADKSGGSGGSGAAGGEDRADRPVLLATLRLWADAELSRGPGGAGGVPELREATGGRLSRRREPWYGDASASFLVPPFRATADLLGPGLPRWREARRRFGLPRVGNVVGGREAPEEDDLGGMSFWAAEAVAEFYGFRTPADVEWLHLEARGVLTPPHGPREWVRSGVPVPRKGAILAAIDWRVRGALARGMDAAGEVTGLHTVSGVGNVGAWVRGVRSVRPRRTALDFPRRPARDDVGRGLRGLPLKETRVPVEPLAD